MCSPEEMSSTASDSPTPTNSVQDRSWAMTGNWQGLVSEEQRQLLGLEHLFHIFCNFSRNRYTLVCSIDPRKAEKPAKSNYSAIFICFLLTTLSTPYKQLQAWAQIPSLID